MISYCTAHFHNLINHRGKRMNLCNYPISRSDFCGTNLGGSLSLRNNSTINLPWPEITGGLAAITSLDSCTTSPQPLSSSSLYCYRSLFSFCNQNNYFIYKNCEHSTMKEVEEAIVFGITYRLIWQIHIIYYGPRRCCSGSIPSGMCIFIISNVHLSSCAFTQFRICIYTSQMCILRIN